MGNANQIAARGTVLEVLKHGAYRIELANGHRCIARAEKNAPDIPLGEKVLLAFHPYDLSRGRIVSNQ